VAVINALGSPTKVDTSGMGLGLFEVVESEGHRVMSCPNRGPSAAAAPFLAPLPRTTQPTNLFVAAPLADQPRYGCASPSSGRT
jgi:hypothetical protein